MAWCETVTSRSHCLNLYGFLTRSNFEGISWQNMLPPLYSVPMVDSSKGEGCNIIYYLYQIELYDTCYDKPGYTVDVEVVRTGRTYFN
jgi:hypothetical protein